MEWIDQNYILAMGSVFALCIMSSLVGSYFEADPPDPPANDYPDCDLCGQPTAKAEL